MGFSIDVTCGSMGLGAFNSEDEEYRVLLPFSRDGFECGDKAVHVVNPDQRRDHLQRLAAVGIDATARPAEFAIRTSDQR
jgi:hypothetical protein